MVHFRQLSIDKFITSGPNIHKIYLRLKTKIIYAYKFIHKTPHYRDNVQF